jgi:hypothetical protein
MILMQSSGGIEQRVAPVFACDICGKPITEISNAAAVFRDCGHGEDELHKVLHVHKDDCLNKK